MSTHRILVGFAEALAAPEVCFSLYDAGYELVAFTRDARTCSLKHLPFMRLIDVPAPEADLDACLDAVSALVGNEKADGIMPLDDFSLWLVTELIERGQLGETCVPLSAAPASAHVALDKQAQVEAARTAGLALPETIVARSAADVSEWTLFPCIAKPARAAAAVIDAQSDKRHLAKFGAGTFETQEELCRWLDDHAEDGPFLVQPLVSGIGEGVFGFAVDGGVVSWSGHQRVRMMNPAGSGSSACKTHVVDDNLKRKIEAFLLSIGWTGPFMIELLRGAEGTPWFMELNGRPWGSMALARRAGFDYPSWMANHALAKMPVPDRSGGNDTLEVRHLGRELIHLLFVLRGPKDPAYKAQWPKLLPTLLKVLRPGSGKGFYNYHPDFRWFFVRDAIATLGNFLRKKA